jgi:bacillithiol synthase
LEGYRIQIIMDCCAPSPASASTRAICLPHTSLPGTSALFADYLYHFDRLERYYRWSPHDPGHMRQAALEACKLPDDRRADTVAALRALNGDSPSLDQLELPDTVAIVTGQQVGLFSGPAYTIYKALTAAKLARQMTESGIRAVPVFWLATEDHDFAEIDHVWLYGSDHRPVKLQSTCAPQSSGQPVGTIELKDLPLAALRQTLEGFLYADEIVSLVEETYQPGRTYGEAFRLLLKRLLAGYGLVFIDPMHARIRQLAAPLVREAVLAGPELNAAVRSRSAALQAAGYHAQVLVEEDTSFFFLLENGKRLGLRMKDGDYYQGARRIETAELADRAESLSPNALLRPVLQDYLLPTAAYVGGPAELAYLAQSRVLYDRLLGRAPVAVSRSGFTLVDEKAHGLLDRLNLMVPDTFVGEETLRDRIASSLIPPALDQTFQETQRTFDAMLQRLRGELAGFDPTLGAAMEKSRAKIMHQVSKNRGKAAREALRRSSRIESGAAHLSGLLFPHKHLQERLYSLLPFLAQHGPELVDTLFEHVCRGCPDHLLLTV